MKISILQRLFFICLGLSLSLSVTAQTKAIVLTATTLDKKANPSDMIIYTEGNKIRIETSGEEQEVTLLFDAENETIYTINHKRKEISEMTRQDIEAFSEILRQQLAVLDKQLEHLPEKQRTLMREKVGAAKPVEYTLEESGVAVKSWKADKFIGRENENKKSEVYIARYETLMLDKKDFEALEKFYSLMVHFTQNLANSLPGTAMSFVSKDMPAYADGIPVKSIIYNTEGEATQTMLLEEVEKKEVADSLFLLPENYKRKKMEGLEQKK